MATILEEFVSIFRARANYTELQGFNNETERTGDVTTQQRPRLARFEESLQNIGDAAKNVVGKLFNLKNAIAGAVVGVVVDKVTKQAEEMYNLGNAYGLSTEKVSEFAQVAGQVGVEFDDVRDAIFQTSKTMGSAFSGIGAGAGFKKDFNLDFMNADKSKKSMAEVFDMYRSKVKNMNKQEQLNFIDEAGINENFLRVFQLGDKEYNKFMSQASKNAITTEQGKQAQEFNRTLASLTNQVASLGRAFVFGLLPYLEKVIKAISTSIDFFEKHAVLVKTFTALIVASGVAFIGYFKILQGFRSFTTFIRYMRMFGNQALIAQAKLFLIPIAVGAIIAGLALLVEDFYNFFNGGDSAIGGLVKKFPELGEVIFKIRDGVMIAFNAIKAIIADSMVTIIKIWDKIGPAVIIVLNSLVKWFMTSFGIMIDIVSSAINVIGDVILGIVDIVSGVFDIIKGIFTGNFDLIKEGFGDLWSGIYNLFFKPLIEGWNLAKKIVGKVASFLGFGGGDDKKKIDNDIEQSIQPTQIAKSIATNKTQKEQPVQNVNNGVVLTDTKNKQFAQLQEQQKKNKEKNGSVLSWFTNKFANTQKNTTPTAETKTAPQGGILDTLNKKLKLDTVQEKVITNNQKEINNTTKETHRINTISKETATNNVSKEVNNNERLTEKNNTLKDRLISNNTETNNNTLKDRLVTNNTERNNNTDTTIRDRLIKQDHDKEVNNTFTNKELKETNNTNTNTLSNTIERNHERTINNNNMIAGQPQEVIKSPDNKGSKKPSKIDGLIDFFKKKLDGSNQSYNANPLPALGNVQSQPLMITMPQTSRTPLGNVHNVVNHNSTINHNKTDNQASNHVEVKAININMNSGSSKEIASNVSRELKNQLNSVYISDKGKARA